MKINHVTLLVKNKDASEKFYTEILGLQKHSVGNSLWIRVGDQFIHLTDTSGKGEKNSFSHFAIETENVVDYVKNLSKKGVEVFDIGKDMEEVPANFDFNNPSRQFFIRDVDGNLIEFVDSGSKFFHPTENDS